MHKFCIKPNDKKTLNGHTIVDHPIQPPKMSKLQEKINFKKIVTNEITIFSKPQIFRRINLHFRILEALPVILFTYLSVYNIS